MAVYGALSAALSLALLLLSSMIFAFPVAVQRPLIVRTRTQKDKKSIF